MFSCLSMRSCRILEQSNPAGTRGSSELTMILFLPTVWTTVWKPSWDNAPEPASAKKSADRAYKQGG